MRESSLRSLLRSLLTSAGATASLDLASLDLASTAVLLSSESLLSVRSLTLRRLLSARRDRVGRELLLTGWSAESAEGCDESASEDCSGALVGSAACTACAGGADCGVVAGAVTDPSTRAVSAWLPELTLLSVAAAGRVAARWGQARLGRAAAGDVVDDLRAEVVRTVTGWDPVHRRARAAELRTVLTGGLDGLVPYLSGYVPALATAAVVTPALLVVVALVDPLPGLAVAVTLPLIPVFMILIGLLTRERTAARHRALTRLSDRTLDLLAGIPTLMALGRQRGPERQLAAVADAHRRAAMSALRRS